jgi:beta-lactamase class A
MTDIYDVPDFIPESTYKNYGKLTPTERTNLENFKEAMSLSLASTLDKEQMQEAENKVKAKEKRLDKKFSYVRQP